MSRLDKAKKESTSTNEDLVASLGKDSKSRKLKEVSTITQKHENTNTQTHKNTKAQSQNKCGRLNCYIDQALLDKIAHYKVDSHKTLRAIVEEAIIEKYGF